MIFDITYKGYQISGVLLHDIDNKPSHGCSVAVCNGYVAHILRIFDTPEEAMKYIHSTVPAETQLSLIESR